MRGLRYAGVKGKVGIPLSYTVVFRYLEISMDMNMKVCCKSEVFVVLVVTFAVSAVVRIDVDLLPTYLGMSRRGHCGV